MKPTILLGCLIVSAWATAAHADDTIKVAVGQINNWENQPPTLGQDAGLFKKHGLVLDNYGTAGAGETIQAVISGSAELGLGVGVGGVLRAFSTGAPVRILAPAFTGTGDLYWYVKADSPLKAIADMTASQSLAYSTNGSSSHNIVTAFTSELGVKGKPTATGSPASTLTSVMSGQIDVGWAAPPFGLQEVKDGKIRILARGSDVPSLKGQTVRVTIVNAAALASRKDAMNRFVAGYRDAVDWMYSDPKAIDDYAKKINVAVPLLKESIAEFHPRAALQTDTMMDLDGAVKDAVKLKYLREPLTKAQLDELIQIPPRAKASQ